MDDYDVYANADSANPDVHHQQNCFLEKRNQKRYPNSNCKQNFNCCFVFKIVSVNSIRMQRSSMMMSRSSKRRATTPRCSRAKCAY